MSKAVETKRAPKLSEVHVATVGVTTTAAVDLFASGSYGTGAVDITKDTNVKLVPITVEADAECFIHFGASDLGAAVATTAKRLAPDVPHFFQLTEATRYYRAIATAADTRLEIVKG